MPRYRTEVAHDLEKAEVLARLKAIADHGQRTANLKGTWTDNTFEFSATVQGVSVRGTVRAEANVLIFDGHLPLLAMPFRNWIPQILKQGLQQAGPGGPLRASSRAGESSGGGSTEPSTPAVLFLHIPKAGGLTLGEYIYNQCRTPEAPRDGLLDDGVAYLDYGFIKESPLAVPAHVVRLLGRRDLRAVLGHFWFGLHEHLVRPYVYVTLLRRPIDRVVSLYYYTRCHERMTLNEFVRTPPFAEVDNDQTRRIAGVHPPIGGCTRETLNIARDHLRRHFAVVGTTERFNATLAMLNLRLGWNRSVASYPRNVNPERLAADELPREALDAVRERNELDYDLWQFASQLLDEAIADEPRFRGQLTRLETVSQITA
jgi:hypothetical protein